MRTSGTGAVVVMGVAMLASCDWIGQDLLGPSVRAPDYLLFAIGEVTADGPPAAEWQDRVPPGMVHFFDNRDPESPEFDCQHDDADSLIKMEELDIPYEIP